MEKKILEVIYTEKSKNDLEQIYRYHALYVSVELAEEIISNILSALSPLEEGYLSIGQREPYLDHLKREYRRIVVSNYKIIYFIGKTGIYVNRIFDARQNPKKMKVR